MNGATCSYGAISGSCKITEVWNPGCYLLWNPDENLLVNGAPVGAFAFNDASSYPDTNEGTGRLHVPDAVELVTVGGDVRSISRQKLLAEANARTRSLVWWNPLATDGR
jgi:hypothetical protein